MNVERLVLWKVNNRVFFCASAHSPLPFWERGRGVRAESAKYQKTSLTE